VPKFTLVVYGETQDRIFGVWRRRTEPVLRLEADAPDAHCAVVKAAEALDEERHEQA
jgi:hypothetical protein